MTKLYCYDHETHNVESKSDDKIHIDIKNKIVVDESDCEMTVQNTKYQSLIVVMILKRRNLVLKKRREKRQHSLRVTVISSQTVNPNTNKSFATRLRK